MTTPTPGSASAREHRYNGSYPHDERCLCIAHDGEFWIRGVCPVHGQGREEEERATCDDT